MYKKIDLVQGTPEWLAWRKGEDGTAITATAASVLMGLYPYGTVFELWQEKICSVPLEYKTNAHTEHGSNTEEEARQEFIKATGLEMIPVCVESVDYPFLRASLDGINEEHKIGLEIKCPVYFGSFNKHKKAPLDYYYAQVQHQLLVCSFSNWALYSYFKGQDVLHIIEKDAIFQEELLRRCELFRSSVISRTPPDLDLYRKYEYC